MDTSTSQVIIAGIAAVPPTLIALAGLLMARDGRNKAQIAADLGQANHDKLIAVSTAVDGLSTARAVAAGDAGLTKGLLMGTKVGLDMAQETADKTLAASNKATEDLKEAHGGIVPAKKSSTRCY